jgi:hypothetical protein
MRPPPPPPHKNDGFPHEAENLHKVFTPTFSKIAVLYLNMKTTLPPPSPGGGWGVVSKIAADVIWEKQKSEKGKEGKCERKKDI